MNDIRTVNKKIKIGFKGIVNTIDESLLSHEYATECENFSFENGVLKAELGIDKAQGYYHFPRTNRHTYDELPTSTPAKRVFLYRRKEDDQDADRIVVQLTNSTFSYTQIYDKDVWNAYPSGAYLIKDAEAVNYNYNGEDILLICAPKGKLFFLKGDGATVCSNAPSFSTIAVHSERVFGGVNGQQTRLWFSDDFNPSNWNVSTNEAGYIDFADGMGDILKLVPFLNYLFIFREYGILRLTAYGNPSDFMLKKVFTDTGRICKDSIVQCGDKIIFYADNGLFAFDGYSASSIGDELPPLYSKYYMCGTYVDDCYFLACHTQDEEFLNNSLIKYDLKHKQFSILHGVQIRYITAVKTRYGSDVLCTFEEDKGHILGVVSKSGAVFGTPTVKHYKSPYNNLSSASVKTIKSISFISKYPITLTVILDKNRYVFDVKGKDETQTIHVEKSGVEFGVEIDTTEPKAYVTPLIVDMDIMAQ